MSGTDSLPTPPTAAFVRVWFDIPSAGLTSSLISVTDTQTTLDLVEKVQAVCQRRDLGDLKGSPADQRFLLCMPSKSHSLFLYPSSMLLWKAAKRASVDTIRLGGSGGAEGRDVLVCAGFLMDISTIREHNPTFEDNAKTALSVKVPTEFKDVLAQMMELYNKDNSPNVIRRRRPDENVADASSTDFAASSLSFNEGSMMGSSSARAPTAGAGEGVVVGSTATPTTTTPKEQKETNGGLITSKIDQQLETKTATATPQQPVVAVTPTPPPTRQNTPVVVPPTRKAAVPLQESVDTAIVAPPPPVAAPTMAAYGVDNVINISLRVQLSPNQPGAVNLSTTVHYYRGDFAQEVVHAALARFRSEASETSKAHGYDVEMLRAAIPTDPTSLMLAVSHVSTNANNNTNNTTATGISSMDDVSMFTADDPLPILSPPGGGGVSNARLVVAPASVRRARSADHQHHPTTSQLSSSGGAPAYISPLKIHRVLKPIPSVRDDPSIDYENRSSRCADLEKHLNKLTAELDAEVAEIAALEKEVALATKERDGLVGSVEDAKAASRDCERLENLKSWLERDLEERVESERSTRNKLYLSDDVY